jgi:predicted DNA-binding transcriptional regulator AlpA
MNIQPDTPGRRFVRRKKVLVRYDIGASTLHDWVKRGTFPPPTRLGPNIVGWFDDELDEFDRAAKEGR